MEFEVVGERHDEPVIGQHGWEKAEGHESWWNTVRTDRDLVVERVAMGYQALYFDESGRHHVGVRRTRALAQRLAEQA